MAVRPGRFVRLDVQSAGLGPWLEGWGMGDAGAVVRMVRGRPPEPAAGEPGLHALAIQAFGRSRLPGPSAMRAGLDLPMVGTPIWET